MNEMLIKLMYSKTVLNKGALSAPGEAGQPK